MPFCSACGTPNPDGARFCAKCGTPMVVSAPPPAPAAQPAPVPAPAPRPAPVAQPAPRPVPVAQPAPAPQPKAQTAKQALAPGRVPVPQTVPDGPDPNAPNATQFFVAAAGVSTGSKIRRVLFFVIGALVIGSAIFALVYFQLIKKEAHVPGAGGAGEPGVEQPVEPGAVPAEPAPAPAPAPAPGEPAPAGPAAAVPAPAPAAAVPAPAPAPSKSK